MSAKRYPRQERRTQLLETAAAIVLSEGTDALTLARVAAAAGVSKPIAYEHFQTRAGLLVALYEHLDSRWEEATWIAIKRNARNLEDTVAIIAASYVDCVLQAGKVFGAIAAALAGTEEMDEFRHCQSVKYAELCRQSLGRYTPLPESETRALMLGLIGAADTLSQAAAAERMARKDAIEALTRIIVGAVRQQG